MTVENALILFFFAIAVLIVLTRGNNGKNSY